MTKKRALITGIYGQDGAYLAKLLLDEGYIVYGMKRRSASSIPWRLQKLGVLGNDRLKIVEGDITDIISLQKIVEEAMPGEVYNTAAMSHVGTSFAQPIVSAEVNGIGVLNLLEVLKNTNMDAKFLQCSTSELFGTLPHELQSGEVFHPRSPYGIAKLFAYWTVRNYREAYKMFAVNSVCYNHESPLRGIEFVTRKATMGIADIKYGRAKVIRLGNIDAKRDWGHAADYCVDLDSKILTPEGFKGREQISNGDAIINYNLGEDRWEYDTVERVYDVKHSGEMYTMTGNGIEFRCSPNHTIYYKRRSINHKSWLEFEWKKCTASEAFEMMRDLQIRAKYNFCFPGFTGLSDNVHDADISDDMAMLMGYILSEGCLYKPREIGGGLRLSISQSKKKYYDELKECIDRLGLEYREDEREDSVVEFVFTSKSRDVILDNFDGYDIHRMPKWVYGFSARQMTILFNAVMNGDGCWSAMSYSSARKELAMSVQDLASILGYRTKLHRRASGQYEVSIFSSAKKSRHNFITEITKSSVEENIWCVETRNNGTIITKKNDTIFVSGNCRAMHMMLQAPDPDDFVIATGETHSIREFLALAFDIAGLGDYEKYIEIDPAFYRPAEVPDLKGDPSKIKKALGWEPTVKFEQLVKEMVLSDLSKDSPGY